MRFSIFIRYSLFFMLILSFLFKGAVHAQDMSDNKDQKVIVNLKVVDENGNPIPGASVVIGEGVKHTETDENGTLSFEALPSDNITVSSAGYDKSVLKVKDLLLSNSVKLIKSKLFMTSDDVIPLPFNDRKKRQITGSSSVILGSQLEKYPTVDLRNAFAGLAPGLEVIENSGATGLSPEENVGRFNASEKVTLLIRGRRPLIMIDDMPSDIAQIPLDPQAIETVTVIKDIVGKAMFGPQAADGIIFIKTKRGSENDRIININIEDGVSAVDRFPEWTTGADYATLNNMARENSGLTSLYTNSDISAYAQNDPYDLYHPSSDYRDLMLKNVKSFKRINLSSKGGNEVVQYFANVGYNGEGDIYKIGPTADYNRISTRSNIDIKVNDLLKVRFDFYGGLTFRRSPNYGYSSNYGDDNSNDATLDIIEFDRVIQDITTISPIAFPVYANNDPSLKAPWFGVTPEFPINPMGRLLRNGYYTESSRIGTISSTFDYNMSNLIDGLSSKTFIGLDATYLIRVGKATEYIAYNVTPSLTSGGADTILLTKAHDGVDMSSQDKLHDYYYQRISFYEKLGYEKTFGLNTFNSTLTYYIYNMAQNGIDEPQREQSLIWSGMYSFNDKIFLQGVLNYAGTYSFDKGKKYELFPSLGLGWVISEENFMTGLKFLNYLKLRAEAGIIGEENFGAPFLYRDSWNYNSTGAVFGAYSTNQWFGTTQDNQVYRSSPERIGNSAISWEKHKEINIGFDASMFSNKLYLEMSYYYNLRDGIITQLNNTLPFIVGISGANPYFNYNKTAYFGLETGLRYTNKVGKLGYSFSASAVVQNSKILKYDEPNYRFNYQARIGKPADSYWGLTNIGKFSSDAEALIVPQIFDDVLHEGDLKYLDMNDDNIIDDNDQSSIGHTTPRLYYSLNVHLTYRNFEMTLTGTGRAFFDIPLTNRYFWNGWGSDNYSTFVRDNIGGSYPKLSYYKVNNNFISSDFWLANGSFLKVQNVELAYNIFSNNLQLIKARKLRLFVRGANLLTISKIKDVDPESVNSGVESYPLYRTFTGGINLTF